MRYLFYEKITEERAKVNVIHYKEPEKEITDNVPYIVVSSIPEPVTIVGKKAVPYCNPKTKEFWYEYEDKPLAVSEEMSAQADYLMDVDFRLSMVELGMK